ncbi:MAG: IS701 family transposase, partial [Okeania sp. SIO2B9]|nr:IS701 family transposase [Okeania sp. SIO2B9]
RDFALDLAGLLGESQRQNIAQITDNIIGSLYKNIHHFIAYAKWAENSINVREALH